MSDNFQITQGSGTTIAADEVVDGTLGTVKTQFVKLMDGTLTSTNKLAISASGAAKTDGSGVTQPISASSLPLPSGASTSAKQPALGTAGTPSADVITVQGVTSMIALKVDPSGVTSPVSGTITANQGGTWTVQPGNTANTTAWKVDGSAVTQPVSGTVSISGVVNPTPATLAVTATGASGAAVTLTLPAVASQFHYITLVEIVKYAAVAIVGAAAPIVVTTTNLPGSPAYTFDTAQAIGTALVRTHVAALPLRSSVVNTATTIVCPATTSVIWRVNVYYYAAV